jgi:hypothetical protein
MRVSQVAHLLYTLCSESQVPVQAHPGHMAHNNSRCSQVASRRLTFTCSGYRSR